MILGLVGKAGAGKDTTASMIPGAQLMSFADPLKEICATVFDWPEAALWGPSELRGIPDPRWDGLTPRRALQTLGTEWGRAMHPEVWVRLGIRRALRWSAANPGRHVIFTDCRFVNEARAIRDAGGYIWRIVRPGAGLDGAPGTHASELEQERPEMEALVSATINNSGTWAELQRAVLSSLCSPLT